MISVIIPVYNSLLYIDRCLKAILNQSYNELEIILINDGSTDCSDLVCNEYAQKDKRIKIINQRNKGVAEARNTGLKYATGKYISFIDIDDIIHPDYFSILINAIKSGEFDMVSCLYISIWEHELINKKELWQKFNNSYSLKSKNFWFNGMLCIPIDKTRNSSFPFEMVWAKLYKKDFVDNIFFENIWGEDQEYNSRVYSRLNKSIIVETPLYIWVQNSKSAHRADPHNNFISFLECTEKIYNNIPSNLRKPKSMALKRTWLGLLSTRFLILTYKQYSKNKKEILTEIKCKAKYLERPLIKSKFISIYFKTGILIFYYLPFTYKYFRWCMPIFYKIKNYFLYNNEKKI